MSNKFVATQTVTSSGPPRQKNNGSVILSEAKNLTLHLADRFFMTGEILRRRAPQNDMSLKWVWSITKTASPA